MAPDNRLEATSANPMWISYYRVSTIFKQVFNFLRSLVTAPVFFGQTFDLNMSGCLYNVKIIQLPSLLGNTRMGF